MDVRRFCTLMHNFWSRNPAEVQEFLGSYNAFLVDLAALKYYTDVGPLHSLIEVLVAPQERKSYKPVSFGGGDSFMQDSTSDVIGVFVDRLEHANTVDGEFLSPCQVFLFVFMRSFEHCLITCVMILSVETYPILQDLDAASSRNPLILEPFAERLKGLLVCNNELCRTLSYSLILKHITYSPRKSFLQMPIRNFNTMRESGL